MTKVRHVWVMIALALSLALPIYFACVAWGVKFHLIDWSLGFHQLTLDLGPKLMLGALAIAVSALITAFVPPTQGRLWAVLALLIPASGLGYFWWMQTQTAAAPPIHDVSTDLMDPPSFSADVIAARRRVPNGNGLALLSKTTPDGASFVEVQQRDYPDIASIPTGLAPGDAFDLTLAVARTRPWRLGHVDRDAGVIEATQESFWFGFVDDIVVRVSPDGSGARIDMRSVSRARESDGGANAERMRPYLEEVQARLREAEGL